MKKRLLLCLLLVSLLAIVFTGCDVINSILGKDGGKEEHEHKGGTPTCIKTAVCEECGETYGEKGEHTCVVSAKDYYGNSTSISLNVTVGPPDVEAPEILFTASEIYVPVGTFSRMVISCVDNYDKVNVVSEWSDGAIDFGGRLFEGTHTLTLTATDHSGNKSVHVVTVYVTDGDTTVGELVKCGG